MLERIRHMLLKEFIHIFRDPRMKFVIFLVPTIQVIVFGYAVTTDIRHISTAVYDLDNTVTSRQVVSQFTRSGYFHVIDYVHDDKRARALLDRDLAQVILRMNKGFEESLDAGRTALLQVIVDGTDSNTAGIILSYTAKITNEYSQEVLRGRFTKLYGSIGKPVNVELQTRAWFNDNLESRNFYVPAVIALLVTLVTLLLTSMAVVREKEIGTMEQIMVTPITAAEFILGKTLPFALIGLIDVLIITVVGVFWFDIPIRGDLLLLFACTALYLMTTLGVGLLVSTISETQQQAMMGCFFFYFPAVLLSGFMFPIANMPEAVQWLTYLNPLRYFIVIIRGIFLKGIGVPILWPQMAALALMGIVTLWLATKRFKKTLG